jgi:hypothetical protein
LISAPILQQPLYIDIKNNTKKQFFFFVPCQRLLGTSPKSTFSRTFSQLLQPHRVQNRQKIRADCCTKEERKFHLERGVAENKRTRKQASGYVLLSDTGAWHIARMLIGFRAPPTVD